MGSSLLYISIAYYMQNGGGWVQIACKIAYVLNGRPLAAVRLCEFGFTAGGEARVSEWCIPTEEVLPSRV